MGYEDCFAVRQVLFIGHFGLRETQDRCRAMVEGIGVVGPDDGGTGE